MGTQSAQGHDPDSHPGSHLEARALATRGLFSVCQETGRLLVALAALERPLPT